MRIPTTSIPLASVLVGAVLASCVLLGCGDDSPSRPLPPNTVLSCGGGGCVAVCVIGFADCDGEFTGNGCEVDLLNDPNHCGRCIDVCSNNHIAVPTCSNGECSGACDAGFADCDGRKKTDGCEKDLTSDDNNCGVCGTRCVAPTRHCVDGRCAI